MRVRYTLPGLQPAISPQTQSAAAPSFQSRLRRIAARAPVSWQQLLRLDRQPAGARTLEPPPVPPELERLDAVSLRLRWRTLIERHSSGLGSAAPQDPAAKMLALLYRMREMEDAVMAQHFSETGG